MFVDTSQQITQEQFGDLVGISKQRVSELVGMSILDKGAHVGQWLHDYCQHLREQAAGRAASGGLDLATERAALARSQREKIDLQNAVTRGELAPVILLEEVLAKAASRIAGVFDAIPGMVRRRAPYLKAEVIDLIAGEIARSRNIVASMSLADLDTTIEAESDDDSGEASHDALEAPEVPL